MREDFPQTADTIQAALMAQYLERQAVYQATGLQVSEDGIIRLDEQELAKATRTAKRRRRTYLRVVR